MAKVVARIDTNTGEKEDVENLIKRFKKAVIKENILDECRKRKYFKSKAVRRREKSIEVKKRIKSAQRKAAHRKATRNKKSSV